MTLTVHHLTFTAEAVTTIALDEQSGSAVRGAISTALWDRFCTNKAAPTCADCPLVHICPVAALVAPMRADDEKGSDQRPRPYVTRPPLGGTRTLAPGERFSFGLGVFGHAAALFPYLVLAAQDLERAGLGRKLPEHGHRRGRLRLQTITSVDLLRGQQQPLYTAGTPQVDIPALAMGPNEVSAAAAQLPTDHVTLRLLTPMRLIEQDRLLKQIALRPLLQRLMRRLDDLSMAYGTGPLQIDFRGLLDHAETVQVANDQTRWVDVVSASSRQQRRTPIGGLVGEVTFVGDLAPLRELLVWGSLVHVGKNAVKGDGWYRLV
jgi:hypothetical protein